MRNYTRCKDMNVVVARLIKQGWVYTAGAHGRLTHPSGKYLTFSMSPSDKYAFRQVERDVKRLLQQLEKQHENT